MHRLDEAVRDHVRSYVAPAIADAERMLAEIDRQRAECDELRAALERQLAHLRAMPDGVLRLARERFPH
jgi:hypothetical protein